MNYQSYRIIAISNKPSGMLADLCNKLAVYNFRINSISSLRLGHSYVVVLMTKGEMQKEELETILAPVVINHELQLIVSFCENKKFSFVKSDAFMRIRGEPQKGINARVISLLTNAGLDIHGLESDIFQKQGKKIFTINVKGKAMNGIEDLTEVAEYLQKEGLNVTISTDWALLV